MSQASTLSRRSFARLAAGAAAAAALPWPAHAAAPPVAGRIRLSSNENPFGPSPAALDAIRAAFGEAGRYPDDLAEDLRDQVGRLHGVPPAQVLLGAGSGEILKWAAVTFAGPGRVLVEAEPTFEALSRHTRLAGGEVVRVPLNGRHEHDLPRMLEASRRADLVYLCNPNNPTATLTPSGGLREFVAAVPPRTVVLVDEAYHHYVTRPDYASLIDLVASHPNLVVARTFSKIFGMAGLRCGYAVSSADTIARLAAHQGWDSLSALTAAAAKASLGDERHVRDHRDRNADTRAFIRAEVERLGFRVLPSEANFVMIDVGRDVTPVIAGLRDRGVLPGRRFAAMPNHLRVTIGTRPEMEVFLDAFRTLVTG